MAYKIIYAFEVFGKIAEGKNVYCLDRKRQEVDCINEISVRDLTLIMKDEEKHSKENLYEFWIEEKMEEVRE